MWGKRIRPRPLDWQLIDILKRNLDWHNSELHRAANEIDRLKKQIDRCYNCSGWKEQP